MKSTHTYEVMKRYERIKQTKRDLMLAKRIRYGVFAIGSPLIYQCIAGLFGG